MPEDRGRPPGPGEDDGASDDRGRDPEAAGGSAEERDPGARRGAPRPGAIYSVLVGVVFVVIIAIAGFNALDDDDRTVIGAGDEQGLPLAQFAVPDARGDLEGDANVAQDDCAVSEIPCPEGERRSPACEIEVDQAIRVCDLFDRPLVLSFWFTRGGDCEAQQDVFEAVYRRYGDRVGFLAINVRGDRGEVAELIEERGWTHPVGLDRDGAVAQLYRVGGCPTFLYAYPGGILHATSLGELDRGTLTAKIDELIAASRERALARR